jgi:toxoflavin synthase
VQDVKRLVLDETFDVVVAAYLLNYAQTYGQLLKMCSAITHHLKPGCRFVMVNNNPQQSVEHFAATRIIQIHQKGAWAVNKGRFRGQIFC